MTKTKLAEYFEIEINALRNLARVISIGYEKKCQFLDRGLGAATLAMLLMDKEGEEKIAEMYEHFKAEILAIGVDK